MQRLAQYDTAQLLMTTPLSDRAVAASTSLSKTTVRRYRRVLNQQPLSWPELKALPDKDFERVLRRPRSGGKPKPELDYRFIEQELKGPGVTRQLLWEEYRQADPEGTLCYSHFAAKIREHRSLQPTVMRQSYEAGRTLSVDYSGKRLFYIDRASGQPVYVELFVGVLPCSSMVYATCTSTQNSADFLKAHVDMLQYFGGVPQILVCDNLKSAVTKPASTGKPAVVQRSYGDLARHYAVAVHPTRPRRPRDKATVEASVRIAQNWILAPLRKRVFHSLEDINASVAEALERLNSRKMTKDGQTRRQRFETLERHHLRPLPAEPYLYGEWHIVSKVPQDYHVAVEGHFYSVPHHLVGERVDARVQDEVVEIFYQRKRVARHAYCRDRGRHTTMRVHQTEAHQMQADRSPEGMLRWAQDAGPAIARFVHAQLSNDRPYLGMSACEQVHAWAAKHGTVLVDGVMEQALHMKSANVTALRRLIAHATKPAHTPQPTARGRNIKGTRALVAGASC